MKRCKIFIVLTVLILAMSLMLVACGDTDSSDGGTALRSEPPEGDFSNNGDNLGVVGVGTLPDQVDDVSTDVFTFSDLSELSANVDYSGATALTESETAIEITESGSYVLSEDTQLATFTISDVITRVGVSTGGGQGGFGGPDGGFDGGGQNPPQKPQ